MNAFDKQLWRLATAYHASLTNQSARGRPISLPSHNWQQCEKLLQQIQRAEFRRWHLAAAELRTDLHSYIGALQSEFNSLSTLLRRRPSGYGISTVGSVYHDLVSLIEEFEEVGHDLRGHWISVTTESITLEDVYLGPFEIRLDWNRIQSDYPYRVIAKDPQPAAGRDNVTHPHVANEQLCEGESHVAIRQAIEQGRLLDFFTLVANGLRSYNPDSPFVALEIWFGGTCVDCGRGMDDDDRYVCQRCQQSVCENCELTCEGCSDSYCSECINACAGCDSNYCSDCLKPCRECRQDMCASCLKEDERCNNCHDKENESTPASAADHIEVQPHGLGQALVSA